MFKILENGQVMSGEFFDGYEIWKHIGMETEVREGKTYKFNLALGKYEEVTPQ